MNHEVRCQALLKDRVDNSEQRGILLRLNKRLGYNLCHLHDRSLSLEFIECRHDSFLPLSALPLQYSQINMLPIVEVAIEVGFGSADFFCDGGKLVLSIHKKLEDPRHTSRPRLFIMFTVRIFVNDEVIVDLIGILLLKQFDHLAAASCSSLFY